MKKLNDLENEQKKVKKVLYGRNFKKWNNSIS
jgi:hypothetical protein